MRPLPILMLVILTAGCSPVTYRGTSEQIAERLMRGIPAGTSRQTLLAEGKARGWKVTGSWKGNRPDQHTNWGGIDGAYVVHTYLDGYYAPFRTDVDAFWAYDEKDRLTGVSVRKMVDAL